MKKNTTLVRESKPSVKLTEHQQNLLKRINNLAISLMPEFEDRNQAIK
ncbi:DNA-binding protein, partial [Salmonella enterica subsp. enterica serovar Javiana]|nr:DNA-binding protein [Salmonella enterica]ECP3431835.1 DNA-binding protein [Salmonella enterica]EDU2243733.1 DNA-binding protein [Salmonella enterica subsp. enterica serovar Javiana]EEF7482206.1 DNA-binding protein [Salmonella enterica]